MDRRLNVDDVWLILQENLLSPIHSKQRCDEDNIIPREESHVASNWGLDKVHMDRIRCKEKICKPSSPYLWSPPPPQVLKLNFDGASTSNLGLVGYGVVWRDSNGRILAIYLIPITLLNWRA